MFKRKSIIALVLASASFSSLAGGGIPCCIAQEYTQVLNNLELVKVALDGAVTAKKTVEQYTTQLKQFQNMLDNTFGLPGLPAGLVTDALKAYNDLTGFKQALTQLQGSLSQQSLAIEARVSEAQLGKMTWKQYLDSVAADVARKEKRAIERLKYEEQVLQQVESDYAFVRKLQPTLVGTIGQHQALQMMNSQMNRVITQNAKMLEVVSAGIRQKAEEDVDRAESKARNTAEHNKFMERQRALDERNRAIGGYQ